MGTALNQVTGFMVLGRSIPNSVSRSRVRPHLLLICSADLILCRNWKGVTISLAVRLGPIILVVGVLANYLRSISLRLTARIQSCGFAVLRTTLSCIVWSLVCIPNWRRCTSLRLRVVGCSPWRNASAVASGRSFVRWCWSVLGEMNMNFLSASFSTLNSLVQCLNMSISFAVWWISSHLMRAKPIHCITPCVS